MHDGRLSRRLVVYQTDVLAVAARGGEGGFSKQAVRWVRKDVVRLARVEGRLGI